MTFLPTAIFGLRTKLTRKAQKSAKFAISIINKYYQKWDISNSTVWRGVGISWVKPSHLATLGSHFFWDVSEVKSADIPFEEDIKLVPKLSTSWIGLSDVLLVTTWAQLLGYQPFGYDKLDPADG